jgi:hypothetical protein
MKNTFQNLKLFSGKLNSNHMRLVWFLITLLLLVIGAGAPEGPTGWGGG